MEIHKPKPAHNVREFLSEIAVVVCGIIIALGLEQAIEAWHWRETVQEEREALTDEVGHMRAGMFGRIEQDPCYVQRLADVKEVIRRHDAGEPLGLAGPMGRPLYPPTNRPLWELAVADQSIAHMSLKEKRRFIDAYEWLGIYEKISADERAAWRSLQVLNHAAVLTDADWSQVRKDYEQAAETHGIIINSLPEWLSHIDPVSARGAPTSTRHAPSVEAFCRPLLKARGA
jgi:hypothetical protein